MPHQEIVTITAVSILEDPTWPELCRTLDPLMHDTRLKKAVIVSTDKQHAEQIRIYAKMYLEKVVLIEESKESGRSRLFSRAVAAAKEQPTDYTLFLEQGVIPQHDFISTILDNYKYFDEEEKSRIILIANTIDIFGKEKSFYGSSIKKDFKDGTVFDLLSLQKLTRILKHLLRIGTGTLLPPVFRTQGYIGGGAFLPTNAMLSAPSPNDELYKYGEDTDYAWKLKEAGYSFYQCTQPILRKSSSRKEQPHVFGLFNRSTPDKDAYYHIRNAVLISRKHTYQSRPVLLINVIVWVCAACALGMIKAPSLPFYLKRLAVIVKAVMHGYTEKHYT